jgi:hypothetical protein
MTKVEGNLGRVVVVIGLLNALKGGLTRLIPKRRKTSKGEEE